MVTNIEALLNNKILSKIEIEIAEIKKCEIYKDNLPLLVKLIKDEIDSSKLSIDKIKNFIESNSKAIINFGQLLLDKSNPKSLSIGISISYSIYMIYLKEKEEEELLEYLKRRKIPGAQKFLEELKLIEKKLP